MPYNHRQKVHDNGTLEVYHIERATDEGMYTCIARNKKGQTAQSSVFVQVTSESNMFSLLIPYPSLLLHNISYVISLSLPFYHIIDLLARITLTASEISFYRS